MSRGRGRQPEAPRAHRRDWAVERLLHGLRPHRSRRFSSHERQVELLASASFVAAAVALPALVPSDRPFSPVAAAALVVAYALASRVRVHVGGGATAPTQLALVPMLLWLPAPSVPLLVACALVLAALTAAAAGREHPERALGAPADAWYAIGAAGVMVVGGEPAAQTLPWGLVVLALAAQCLVDLVSSVAREWLGRGIPPSLQLRVIASVYVLDLCLTPIAVLASARDVLDPSAVVATLALLAFLAALAIDRRVRIDEVTQRLDELEDERRRTDAAIRAIGDALGAKLDRSRLLTLAVRAATDALGAERGRATVGGTPEDSGTGPDPALLAAEDAARRGVRPATAVAAGRAAVAHPLAVAGDGAAGGDVVSLSRAGRPFSEREQRLFGDLVRQMAVALENVALHERVTREARTDELTGLPNHRAFQEALATELERTRRFHRPVALAMIDLDAFKAVNDTHGHQQGDDVLRCVATAIREACRGVDTPARYGGEEYAVVFPGTDVSGARVAAEGIRRAVEALRVPLPDGQTLQVTVSIGVAATGLASADPATLIAAADAQLYAAKRGGRNQTVASPEPVEA